MRVYSTGGMSNVWTKTWPAYVRQQAGSATPKEIARSGVSASTVRRWLNQEGEPFSQPDVETVALFARMFHPGHLDEALVAAGRVRPDDINRTVVEIETSLSNVSAADLLKKLAARLAEFR